MTFQFVGAEIGAWTPFSSNSRETTDNYDSGFARCNIWADKGSDVDYLESAPGAISGDDLWLHMDLAVRSASVTTGDATQNARLYWYDGSGTPVIRIVSAYASYLFRLDYWNGSTWVTAGSSIALDLTTRQTIDLHAVVNSASGSLKLYVSGTERIDSGTVNLSGITSLGKLRVRGGFVVTTLGAGTYASQVIVADEPTIGMRLFTRYANGAGATGDWTGGYTDIDETVYSDADFINSATDGQVELFTQTGPSITGYVVRAVGISTRAKCGAGGPQNLQNVLRVSSNNYVGSTHALDVGYDSYQDIWDQNPATSADWLNTAIDAIQFGVKAIT